LSSLQDLYSNVAEIPLKVAVTCRPLVRMMTTLLSQFDVLLVKSA